MKILITGAAGFIGSHLSKYLAKKKHKVIGIDCISDYYDKKLKLNRLKWIGKKNFLFIQLDLLDKKSLDNFFLTNKIDLIIHLAAQPGVIYSMENPFSYIENNIKAYLNLLEGAKKNKIMNIIYASSSSVYGNSSKIPFKENANLSKPLTVYAATKITDEHISYVYSNLYSMNFIGLRFFTVYGPWGRPDMSPFIFTKKIISKKEIELFDNGNGIRDFTFIDDVILSIDKIVENFVKTKKLSKNEIYNIGNGNPIKISKFLSIIEKVLNIKAKKVNKSSRVADMKLTFSDNNKFYKDYNFVPKFNVTEGVIEFIKWFKKYYKIS